MPDQSVIVRKQATDKYSGDSLQTVPLSPHCALRYDPDGNGYSLPILTSIENFELLPAAAVAAGTSKLVLTTGTGTEVIARAATGGVNIKTQASTPAISDDAMVAGVATTGFVALINAKTKNVFRGRMSVTTITTVIASIGLNENPTTADPTGTAGEGAMFVFDPGLVITTGLASGAEANWILAHKVNGADTFTDTGVLVVAGLDYDFRIEIGADLKALYYINGVLVGTGPALTDGDSMSVHAAVQTKAAAQRDINVRFLSLSRQIG